MSQLQEPYSSVGYLCERTPFLSVLKLKHPSLLENDSQHGNQVSEELSWTAWDVCEGKLNLRDTKHLSFLIFLKIWSWLYDQLSLVKYQNLSTYIYQHFFEPVKS